MLPTSLAPKTMAEAMEFSKLIAQSSMVPASYKGKPADVLVAVQWGAELGLAPLQALQNIACINGKPSVYGDAALALVRGSAVCEDVEEYVEGDGEQMVATCIAKRKGCKQVVSTYSVQDAKMAGLWRKSGPWQQYPKRMLQMRARGFALRDAFPDVLKGLITAEEAQDYPRTERDITPAPTKNPLDQFAPPKITEAIPELANEPAPEPAQIDPEPVIEGEVVADVEQAPGIALVAPGGETLKTFDSMGEWVPAYLEMMDKVEQSKKYNSRTKMTKLRELREANESTISTADTLVRARIQSKYTGILRLLGAQNGEEGGDAS